MYLAQLNRDASSVQRLREQMNRTGETLDGHPLWTNDEDEVLRKHYPDFQTIRAKLPRRNRNSIWFRCQRIGSSKSAISGWRARLQNFEGFTPKEAQHL